MSGGPKQRSNLSLMADVAIIALAALTALAVLVMWFARSDALSAIASGSPPRLMAFSEPSSSPIHAASASSPALIDDLEHRLLLPRSTARSTASSSGVDRTTGAPEPREPARIIDPATGRQLFAYALSAAPPALPEGTPESLRFGDRVMTPDRVLRMKVTAYSPDDQSCGIWADGVTASGYSVWTNAMKLVAADADLMPFGTVLTVPGYNQGQPVPVLDRGGKIKGHRLDVLFPTHKAALAWGVRELDVVVWKPAGDATAPSP